MINTVTLPYSDALISEEREHCIAETLSFSPVSSADMPRIWKYLQQEPGRTCDFSFGGLYMWVDTFHYEAAVVSDTLFIKGRLENDLRKTAFSLPIGSMPLSDSVELLRAYCLNRGIPLRFSAIPEYCLSSFMALNPKSISLLEDWGDYLYEASALATLSGRKLAKKRNHVNQYLNLYGSDTYERINKGNIADIVKFMNSREPLLSTAAEKNEHRLALKLLLSMRDEALPLEGGLLRIGGEVVAFTIGDVKGDTLFIHVEKAGRDIQGAYEMINREFAADQLSRHPLLSKINREDDAGDPGLRKAKLSYRPIEILKKYNVIF